MQNATWASVSPGFSGPWELGEGGQHFGGWMGVQPRGQVFSGAKSNWFILEKTEHREAHIRAHLCVLVHTLPHECLCALLYIHAHLYTLTCEHSQIFTHFHGHTPTQVQELVSVTQFDTS